VPPLRRTDAGFALCCSVPGPFEGNFSVAAHEKTGHSAGFGALQYTDGAKPPLAKFEECLQRLEKIVQELEKGEVPLEKSLALFEEGMQLSSTCRKELEQAEGKVEILLKKNGKLQAEPFEPLSEKASARR
jgi:exodeoxyribonuclease VII small subunit